MASALLNKALFFAPTPHATIIATGVASPNAHGQLITSTDMAYPSAVPTERETISHTIKSINAIPRTNGTNTPETLSATLDIGAFIAALSSTVFII